MSSVVPIDSRRDFTLPSDEVAFLESEGRPFELLVDGGTQWLLIRDFAIPPGYTVDRATLAIQIPVGFPLAGLDMAWFSPPIARLNGTVPPCCDASNTIEGRVFQRWSRHYPWDVDRSSLTSHLKAVEEWLTKAAAR